MIYSALVRKRAILIEEIKLRQKYHKRRLHLSSMLIKLTTAQLKKELRK